MESDYVYAMQSYCLPKYQELFKVIANLGGCILRQQLTRLLFKNRTDYSQADALVKKLLDAKLVKIQYIGRNSVPLPGYPPNHQSERHTAETVRPYPRKVPSARRVAAGRPCHGSAQADGKDLRTVLPPIGRAAYEAAIRTHAGV